MAKAKAKEPTRAAASRAAKARPGQRSDPERWNRVLILGGVAAVILLVIGIIGYGYWSEEVQPLNKTVVRVDDTEISLAHLQRRVEQTVNENSFILQSGDVLLALPQTTATQLEREAKLLLAAEELGVTASDEEIEARLLQEANLTADADPQTISEAIARLVNESGLRQEEFFSRFRADVLEQKVRQHFTEEAPATDEQVKARWIVVEDEAAANRAAVRLNGGGDFAAIAREVSTDTATKDQGGAVDWRLRGAFTDVGAEIETFLFAADIGDRSAPIAGTNGFYIVELVDEDAQRALTEAQKGEYGAQKLNEWLADLDLTHRVERDLTDEDILRVLDEWIS
jgi:parvulin-like peptidyl-prolyl isomerase